MQTARTLLVVFVVSVLTPCRGAAQDEPFDLGQLRGQVGTWDAEMTVKPAAWTREGAHLKFVQTFRPVLQGRFVQSTYDAGDYQFMSMATYDSKEKVYRLWMYDSMGAFPKGDTLGKGDAESRTIVWRNEQGDGVVSTSKWHFIDDDHFEWSAVVKDKEGKTCLDLEGKGSRRK